MARRTLRSRRQRLLWIPFVHPSSGLTTVASGALVSFDMTTALFARFPEMRNYTIVRTLMEVWAQPLGGGNSNGLSPFACGITLVSLQAFAAGVGSVPDPEDDLAAYMWFKIGALTDDPASVGGSARPPMRMFDWDMGVGRYADEANKRLIFVWKNMGTPSQGVHLDGRLLIKTQS